MSIIQSFKKVVDPLRARQEEAERKAQREQPVMEEAGDPPTFVCRICGLEAADGTYCPDCLADTMEPATPGRTEPSSSWG